MKRFLDCVIFCLIILLIVIANNSFWGKSFTSPQNELTQFDKELNITQILYSKEYAPKVSGYGGHIPMAIGLDENGIIKDIKILKNNETPEFLSQASSILNKWIGKNTIDASKIKVDAVSGATMSSEAIIKNMNAMLNNKTTKEHINHFDLYKSLAVLFIGLLGLFSFFAPKKANKFRVYFLSLSIFVLGIWQGSMISVAKISAWLLNGMPNVFEIPLFLIFIVSIILPLMTGKNFYCYNICPFGAAQDLVAKSMKLDIKIKIFKWMQYIKIIMLLACFILLILGYGFYIGNIEPFSAFKPEYAPISAIIIFVASLIIATFSPRFWCKYCCPCGALLDLFKKKEK